MAGSTRRRGIVAEINVTPLVDIMLVLLIIFMLTAHLIARQAIAVDLPRASSSSAAPPTTLTITLTRDGALYLNAATVTPAAQMARRLSVTSRLARSARPDRSGSRTRSCRRS